MIEQPTQDSVSSAAVTTAALVKSTTDQTTTSLNIQYIQRDISEMKQSLKELSGVFATKAEVLEIVKIQQDHETRTRWLEKSIWKFIGMGSLGGAVVGIVASYLLKLVK